MARVPYVVPEAATELQQAAFAEVGRQRGAVGHLWQAMAHSPQATRQVGALGAFIRFEAELPAALRGVVILAVAGRWGCPYERGHHEPLARRLGVSEAAIAALAAGQGDTADLGPLEAAGARYA